MPEHTDSPTAASIKVLEESLVAKEKALADATDDNTKERKRREVFALKAHIAEVKKGEVKKGHK